MVHIARLDLERLHLLRRGRPAPRLAVAIAIKRRAAARGAALGFATVAGVARALDFCGDVGFWMVFLAGVVRVDVRVACVDLAMPIDRSA